VAEDNEHDQLRNRLALQKSEEFFRQVMELAPNAIVMISPSGLIEMVNAETERVFGYTRNELLGKPVEMLVPERYRPKHAGLRKSFIADAASRPMGAGRDLYALRRDGSEFPVEIGLNPMATEEGTIVLSAIVDISARKRLEERAHASEREVADQARSAGQALDLLASVSRVASAAVNPRVLAFDCLVQFAKSGGWQFGQLWYPDPGTDVIKCSGEPYFGGPEFAAFHLSSINLGLQKGEGLPGRVWKNRAPVWIADFDREDNFPRIEAARAASFKSALAFPVISNEEVIAIFELYSKNALPPNPTLMDAVVKLGRLLGDILERKRSELALRAAHSELARVSQFSAMGVMTASIGHELSQPLAAMVANANAALRWISKTTPDLDEVRANLKRIVGDGQRTGHVLRTIRAMFKQDSVETALVDVNDLIRDVIDLVHGEVHKHRVLVQTELADKLPRVPGNRIQLQQVILNLIMNAIEAMSKITGRVRMLRLKSENHETDDVMITVEDSGTGIDSQNIERIFDALFTTKSHGMGMGLSICRSIIEAHHGRLWASPGANRGSVFHVVLPTTGAGGK
jgi:PAS domain S-box-containing protein